MRLYFLHLCILIAPTPESFLMLKKLVKHVCLKSTEVCTKLTAFTVNQCKRDAVLTACFFTESAAVLRQKDSEMSVITVKPVKYVLNNLAPLTSLKGKSTKYTFYISNIWILKLST